MSKTLPMTILLPNRGQGVLPTDNQIHWGCVVKVLGKKLVLGIATVAALLQSVPSSANNDFNRYYSIKSVDVKELTEHRFKPFAQPLCEPSIRPHGVDGPSLDGITLDQIINLGQKIWTIVEKNRPVVNLKVQKADALPAGVKEWTDLECWQIPESRVYRVSYKNGFGMTVVNIAFRVNYTYGGRVDGQGRYLSQVTVLPAQLDVAWGFKVNGEVRVANVTNAGTKAFPIGAIQMDVNWVISTPIKYSESTETFYVRGDGLFRQLR